MSVNIHTNHNCDMKIGSEMGLMTTLVLLQHTIIIIVTNYYRLETE